MKFIWEWQWFAKRLENRRSSGNDLHPKIGRGSGFCLW